jgi:hypothetical protein
VCVCVFFPNLDESIRKKAKNFVKEKNLFLYGLRVTLGSCWQNFLSIFEEGGEGVVIKWNLSSAKKHSISEYWAFLLFKMPHLFFHIYFLCKYPSDTRLVPVFFFFGFGGWSILYCSQSGQLMHRKEDLAKFDYKLFIKI